MIGKVLHGRSVAGLLYYLFGPGRREEHTDPHLVAGWRHPAELEPPLRPDGHRDFRRLNGLLDQPHAALGPRGFAEPVWHCVVRAAPGDRMLSDAEWGRLARDIMHRTGLAPHGQDDEAVRWVAVRHAPDHIHVVAMLARQDGTRPRCWNDFYRVREACQAAEERLGLRRTAPADRTAGRRPTRAEQEKARRNGRSEAPRITLRRAVSTAAAGAASEEEFFAGLRDAGVLVRIRYSSRDRGQITGYAVALAGDTARTGGPVWFGGAKLAADLSLPKLRARRRRRPAHADAGFVRRGSREIRLRHLHRGKVLRRHGPHHRIPHRSRPLRSPDQEQQGDHAVDARQGRALHADLGTAGLQDRRHVQVLGRPDGRSRRRRAGPGRRADQDRAQEQRHDRLRRARVRVDRRRRRRQGREGQARGQDRRGEGQMRGARLRRLPGRCRNAHALSWGPAGNSPRFAAPASTPATASRWRSRSAPSRPATGRAATRSPGTATRRKPAI